MASGNNIYISKTRIKNCIENNKEYMKSIEDQRKAIIASISDYQELEDAIYLRPYFFEIKGVGGYADPTSKLALSHERKMEEERIKRKIRMQQEALNRNLELKEQALNIISTMNATMCFMPRHYHVIYSLWYEKSTKYSELAASMHKGKAAIAAMLDNETEAIQTIIQNGQLNASINEIYQAVKSNKQLFQKILRYEK